MQRHVLKLNYIIHSNTININLFNLNIFQLSLSSYFFLVKQIGRYFKQGSYNKDEEVLCSTFSKPELPQAPSRAFSFFTNRLEWNPCYWNIGAYCCGCSKAYNLRQCINICCFFLANFCVVSEFSGVFLQTSFNTVVF